MPDCGQHSQFQLQVKFDKFDIQPQRHLIAAPDSDVHLHFNVPLCNCKAMLLTWS